MASKLVGKSYTMRKDQLEYDLDEFHPRRIKIVDYETNKTFGYAVYVIQDVKTKKKEKCSLKFLQQYYLPYK